MQRPAALKVQDVDFFVLNYFTKPIAKEFYMRYNIVGTYFQNCNFVGVELTLKQPNAIFIPEYLPPCR